MKKIQRLDKKSDFHKKELEKMKILLEEKKNKSLKVSQKNQLNRISENSGKKSPVQRELKKLRRQLRNRNHKYELEGFISEETILRRIKELESLLTEK